MLPRAQRILHFVERELTSNERAIEVDQAMTVLDIKIIFGSRGGNPVKLKMVATSEKDLTEDKNFR